MLCAARGPVNTAAAPLLEGRSCWCWCEVVELKRLLSTQLGILKLSLEPLCAMFAKRCQALASVASF